MMDICLSVKTGFSLVPTKALAERGCVWLPDPVPLLPAVVAVVEVAAAAAEADLLLLPSMGSGELGAE